MVIGLSTLDRLVAMFERSKTRQDILKLIKKADRPLGSSLLAIETGLHQSTVIRALNELEEAGAIQEVAQVKRGRRYRITKK